ncbi:peroxiredoxin family protein [Blastopirellula sp. JC732]|uniref:Peroxiredoxin family protein n=1 Tax=Blastopirellula sediminis TaxID=2894196 RepID=A0A9X1MIU7_9BACT|nr:peroxiredoxin family protein [Blastopirellula sediminis]MCC9609335.1 peroxiredoxin family protein [Blastopirellula sediminis]MCC9627888.1 peroxiredoxin family protein [Blastopirellula sediminis]
MKTFSLLASLLFATLIVGALSAEELKVGAMAPNFEVETVNEGMIKLGDFRGKKLVLAFNRAHWCPACMKQIKDIQDNYAKIKEAGAEVLVIFREEEDGESGLEQVRKITGAEFPLGLDLTAVQTREYSQDGYSTYVIDAKGSISQVLTGTDPERPLAGKILSALK